MLAPQRPLETTDYLTASEAALRPRSPVASVSRSWRMSLVGCVLSLSLGAACWQLARGGEQVAPPAPRAAALGQRAFAALPLAAQAQISATLGAQTPDYRVHGSPGRLVAVNPAEHLSAGFTSAGVEVGFSTQKLALSLRGLGYGASLKAVAPVAPSARNNRVSYAHEGIEEWYANGPAGLEQGFTVPRAPARHASGPLTLSIGLASDARLRLATDHQHVAIGVRGQSLRYGGLSAVDADGRALRSSLAIDGGTLLVRVDAAGARYPLSIDPLLQREGKLTGGGEEGQGQFGVSATLSADGSTALIGGPRDDAQQGAVWVFTHSGAVWAQQGSKLTSGTPAEKSGTEECAEEASEEAGECAFGSTVALSADGNTALVGDPSATARPGSAWVFTRSGSSWSQGVMLSGGGGSGEGRFGRSVALSGDGNTALVGDPSAEAQRGAAWVFTRAGIAWTPQATISDGERSRLAHFGRSVALAEDGDTALVGAPGDSGFVGAAWAFERAGSTWTQQAKKLTGPGEVGVGHFGKSVALSGDGGTALVGGLTDNNGRGAAWTLIASGSSFEQQGEKLEPEEATGEPHFGASLALSRTGDTALIGSPRAESGVGAVTVLMRTGSTWSRLPTGLAGSDAVGKGGSGSSAALSADGNLALISAPRDGAQTGAAWVFANEALSSQPSPTVGNVTPGHGPPSGGTAVTISGTNLTGATAVHFGASSAASFVVKSATLIKTVSAPGTPGTVDVTVTTPSGTSAISQADAFRFVSTGEGAVNGSARAGAGGAGAGVAVGGVLGLTEASGAGCRVSLSHRRLAVQLHRRAALRLLRTGSGACRGRVTLSYRLTRHGKHVTLRPIGVARFSISPGRSQVVRINLSRTGRALLRSRHGRLNASLAIVRVQPSPVLGRTASVRLSVSNAPKPAAARKK